ncbi:MAG TPA: S8 family serine peptidase [Thermoplasmata archaeon]
MNEHRMTVSLLLAFLMTVTAFAVLGSAPVVAAQEVAVDVGDAGDTEAVSVDPEYKLDSDLADALKKSAGPHKVYVAISDVDLANQYLAENGLPLAKGVMLQGLPMMRIMDLSSEQVTGLAANSGVVQIMTYHAPEIEQADSLIAEDDGLGEGAPPDLEDLDVDILHGATDAWMNGYTGDGVKIAVIDTGFDMAHPDLQGQQARYEDPGSPYFGWPIAYDDMASYMWANGMIGGWVADTSYMSPDYGGFVEFDGKWWSIMGLRDVSGNPVFSQSGWYQIGYHTDANLEYLMGERVGVLVVDSVTPWVYDTVYVDIMDDYDFSNDKACTQYDEISYFDFYDAGSDTYDFSNWDAGDGYADLSGGMVYWISDGSYPYPGSDWLWGGWWIPPSGYAVAFMGEFGLGESHGTMTSSAALATGETMGSQLMGMAPDAKLIAIPFTYDVIASWLFAEFGADGTSNSGDEANIVSNSYGWSTGAIDAGYGFLDAYASLISDWGGATLWCWSTGNGGPGYGTVHPVDDFRSIHVGAGTTQQYRYQLGMEYDYAHTKYGDVAPFSNSGPTRTGKLNAEIIASGMYSMEPAPLNTWDYTGWIGDGSVHFQLGSGTSHATPTVAGGAALGFQAYYDAWGDWPYMDYAKAKLMAAADDMHFDPLRQGSGWLNADTYTRTMGEWDGVDSILWAGWNEPAVDKAALYPGSVYGTRYESFPNLMLPGEVDESHMVETINWGGSDAMVNISSQLLLRTGSASILTTTNTTGSVYVDITSYVPSTTDLLRVTMYMPMSQFDPELDYVSNVAYWLELHDWWDDNGDGAMNITGGEWELYRYAVDGSDCNYNQISIKDPIDRTSDGLIARIRAAAGAIGMDITLQLDFYELQVFPWIQIRPFGDVSWYTWADWLVPSYGSVLWEVRVAVPGDAPVGTYAAGIYVNDGMRVQCIPVVINVAAPDYEFDFGGPSYFDTPYNNDITGIADRGWRFEVGDWRMYWVEPSMMPSSSSSRLTVVAEWTELPTDVNLHVLAPSWDPYGAMSWPWGPGLIEIPLVSSDERYLGAGTFESYTNTGGPKEVLSAPLGEHFWWNLGMPAPFAILTRCPVMSGNTQSDTLTGYTTWITMNDYQPRNIWLDAPQPGAIGLNGTIQAWYDIAVGAPVEVRGGGVGPLQMESYPSEAIWQDTLTGDFEADLANAAYTRGVEVSGSTMLRVTVDEVWGAEDIDLAIWYDENWNYYADSWEQHWYVGASGSYETLTLNNPADGRYLVKVLGYTVSGDPGWFSLEILVGVPGHVTAVDLEPLVDSGVHYFNVSYSVPAVAGVFYGWATFGFMGANDSFRIDFAINVWDVGPPEIQFTTPEQNDHLNTNRLTVEFYVNDHVSFYTGFDPWDWGAWWIQLDNVVDLRSVGMWSAWDETIYIEYSTALAEGYHWMTVGAMDISGNWAWNSTWFYVNTMIEQFTATMYDPGTGWPIQDGQTVALDAVNVYGTTDPESDVWVSTLTGSYWAVADLGGWYYISDVALVPGLNVLTVITTNPAGVSDSMLKMVVSDMYCMLWLEQPDSPTRDAMANVYGWTDAGATVTVDGVPVSVNPDGTFGTSVALAEGMNSIYVEATDAVGNVQSGWVDIELDTTPPTIGILAPENGYVTDEPSVEVYGVIGGMYTALPLAKGAADNTGEMVAALWATAEGMTYQVMPGETMALDTWDAGVPPAPLSSATMIVTYFVDPDYNGTRSLLFAAEGMPYASTGITPVGGEPGLIWAEFDLYAAGVTTVGQLEDLNLMFLNDGTTGTISFDSINVYFTVNIGSYTVYVNGVLAGDGDADWSARVVLAEGNNTIMVTAIDEVGNIAVEYLTVEYVPPVYVTPEELAAVEAELKGMINNLTAAMQENVTDLQGQIDALAASLAENVTDLNDRIDAAMTEIASLQADIANLTAELALLQARIADAKANITLMQAQVAALESALDENYTDLNARIDDAMADIASLQAQVNATVADIASLQTQMDAAMDEIDALQASLASNVTALQNQINTLNADVSDLEDALAENVTALTGLIDALANSVDQDVASLQAQIDSAEANITALENDLATQTAALQTQIDVVEADVALLEDELSTEVVNLQTQVDALGLELADLSVTVAGNVTDLQDQIDQINEDLQNQIDDVESQANDNDAFADMLMYLTLILFAISIALIGVVWYLMGSRARGGGGSPQALEEVEEGPSDVEREFEQLEKEIKNEEA